ncbi:MAG: GNAT family N-acetyltransferase [Nitrospirae bacterium]|nr:GNAT family N-acetyltransferase [Nitrospirota bacterium]
MSPGGPDWAIAPLSRHHDRAGFTCGDPALDRYLRELSGQDAKRNLASPFVLTRDSDPKVAGYYTLSAQVVELAALPPHAAHQLPGYPSVPATLLGRLAVALAHQKQGLGGVLLRDALQRAATVAEQVASYCVVVDALPPAVAFYGRLGFIQLPGRPDRLFLPMTIIRKTLT